MMYHFMFGFCGTAPSGAAAVSAFAGPGAASASVRALLISDLISSSVMFRTSAAREHPQHMVKGLAEDGVNNPKIKAKQEHGNDDDYRRALDLFAVGNGDLPHLGAHVVVKALDALRPRLDRAQFALAHAFHRC